MAVVHPGNCRTDIIEQMQHEEYWISSDKGIEFFNKYRSTATVGVARIRRQSAILRRFTVIMPAVPMNKRKTLHNDIDEALHIALQALIDTYRELAEARERGDDEDAIRLGVFKAQDSYSGESIDVEILEIETCSECLTLTILGNRLDNGEPVNVQIDPLSGEIVVYDPDEEEQAPPHLH